MTRSAAEVRNDFLEFFRARQHAVVPGWPVVPYDDPTLLFTNAGMNQFKDVFLGTGTRPYTRAADTQPCIRAGGKHNDLDDVGQDTYHHTFFEMLGNWSFGDYFKKEAIEWAWELLTDVWGLEKDRLHATYFQGDEEEGLEPDVEARDLWLSVTDIDPTHIHPGSKKDNFWEMGDVGPCGPCSEIHIDLTPDRSGIRLVNAGDARVIEIWNLVFIQSDSYVEGDGQRLLKLWDECSNLLEKKRSTTGYESRQSILREFRRFRALPARHVDTGMGFERVCALLQGKTSNYDTDVFTPIFQAIRDVTGAPPYRGTLPREGEAPAEPADRDQVMLDVSYRVIADHIRCLTFALNDGAVPDREGRGYVLRRILRRAVRYGWQYMNMREPFLYKLVPAVVDTLGDAFPQLKGSGRRPAGRDELTGSPAVGPERVAAIIREEEESFDRTLDRGIALFERAAAFAVGRSVARRYGQTLISAEPKMRGLNVHLHPMTAGSVLHIPGWTPDVLRRYVDDIDNLMISGEDAFTLYDTHGFPIDLTQLMAEEKGLTVDIAEYERLMERAREHARAASTVFMKAGLHFGKFLDRYPTTDDDPKYTDYTGELTGTVCGLIRARKSESFFDSVSVLEASEPGVVLLDRTCFYGEAGGQIGDSGFVRGDSFRFEVEDTQKLSDRVLHCGTVVEGQIRIGQTANLEVDRARRSTMQNHTATHVMNWALREVLGEHVQQKGSLVDPEKTRFDFSHPKPLTPEEIERVEQLVNERIRENLPVHTEYKPTDQARNINGLRAVFGEKYPDPVRVVCCGVPIDTLVENPDNAEWRRYPIELCGGTHCKSTGQIEHFAIVSEEAVAKGIRRVVGISGEAARLATGRGAELLERADDLRRVGTAHQDVAAGPRTGRDVASVPRGRRDVAAGAPAGRPDRSQTGPTEDLVSQVAELQQAVNDATIRVVDRIKLREAISELQQIIKRQQKAEAAATKDVVADKVAELLEAAPKIGQTTVVVAEMPDLPIDQLKTAADMIKQKCKSAAVLFGVWFDRPSEPGAPATAPSEPGAQATGPSEPEAPATESEPRRVSERTESEPEAPATAPSEPEAPVRARGKALLLAAISNDLVKRGLKAGDLIKHVAPLIDGRGGGPPTMAQAGGKAPERIPDALAAGRSWIEQRLG